MSVNNVLKFAADEKTAYVNVRFTDLVGAWHHLTFPIDELSEKSFEDGFGFDGSSLRGWASIHESDMLLVPDPYRYWIDPFMNEKTLCLVADVVDPITREGYWLDPRGVGHRAENYLKSTGIADTVYFGPEAEFFVFNDVRFQKEGHSAGFSIDNPEAIWNTNGQNGNSNLGYHIRNKEGYVPLPPLDTLQDFRTEVANELKKAGIRVECHHHEVATAGQCEIDFRYSTLIGTADNLQIFKYTVRNVAKRQHKGATFMPKPLFGDNGSGMHCHQSLWNDGVPLMYDETGYAGLSDTARHYIGGLLYHAPSLLAFTNPTVNSYKRLVPGFEAPINLVYSQRNRSACVRIPITGSNPKAKRLEFRCPDASGNPYLSFSAMLMAGLDGIKNKIEPQAPVDKDLYELPPEEAANIPQAPTQLSAVIDRLEADHEYLTEGGVFTPDLIETWISFKRDNEILPVQVRPHPYEFALYYDV